VPTHPAGSASSAGLPSPVSTHPAGSAGFADFHPPMTLPVAVALLALLVALFTLVALVAVYARVRALESAMTLTGVSGYASLVGRAAPPSIRPGQGQRRTLVAVLDADCGICHDVLAALTAEPLPAVRTVALADRTEGVEVPAGSAVELLADPAVRAELFEGYAPTLLVVDDAGAVRDRRFVYPDTDLPALVRSLTADVEVARA
jgi:hypothetical protein